MSQPVETDTLRDSMSEVVPGLVMVFSGRQALMLPVPLEDGAVELGREHPILSSVADTHLSRRHLRVRFQRKFLVEDLGSHNGTAADGAPVKRGSPRQVSRVIRMGETLLIPVRDIGLAIKRAVEVTSGQVTGFTQRDAVYAVERAATQGRTVQILGEHGTGKEALARAWHAAGPARGGPFQVMRCTALPESALDVLLFGSEDRRAAEAGFPAGGYLRAAHGGTLFLEGVAHLSDIAQGRLLHLLAKGQLLPLGGLPEPIDVRLAFSAREELRSDVEAGMLLEDLYYRLAAPRVTLPPLRERGEEIPYLVAGEVQRAAPGLAVEASLVEACLLRWWPGNVRELLAEVRNATEAARAAGSAVVGARFLSPHAGAELRTEGDGRESYTALREPRRPAGTQLRERIKAALSRSQGNITVAAHELQIHRTQLRRYLDRFGIDPSAFFSSAGER